MTIDPQLYAYLIAALPALVAFVAGILRQDRLPPLVNEAISDVLGVSVAIVQAWQGGRLGGSPTSDFAIVAAYTLVVMHTPIFQSFQRQIQSNVPRIGSGKAPAPVQAQAQAPALDIPTLALAIVRNIDIANLVAMLRDEMIKSSRQAQATMTAPTVPQPVVRASTPPPIQPPVQPVPPPPSAAWMNSGPQQQAQPQTAWQQLQQTIPPQQSHGG